MTTNDNDQTTPVDDATDLEPTPPADLETIDTPPANVDDAPADDSTDNNNDPAAVDDTTDADADADDTKTKSLRDEAKKYRLKLRETETERDQLRAELDALKADIDTKQRADDRAKAVAAAAQKHGVSADLIRGETPDELDAHAAALAVELRRAQPNGIAKTIGNHPTNHGNFGTFADAFTSSGYDDMTSY